MSFGIFLIHLLACGIAAGVSVNSTSNANETSTSRRSGRTYDGPVRAYIPVGYYQTPQDEDSASSEAEDDSAPRRDVPTSFDDFRPSGGIRSRNKYTGNVPSQDDSYKGTPPQINNWKGSWKGASPSWMTPSPDDMALMLNFMKGMNGDQTTPDEPTGLLSKLISDPTSVIASMLLPAAILIGALLPILVPMFTNANNANIPTVSTTATGSNARKRSDNPNFVAPILEMIENFSARSVSGDSCMQKRFCEATRGTNHTDFRPLQERIYKTFTFVDDSWLEVLGVKELKEAMKNGDCEKIHCDSQSKPENDSKKKLV